MTIFQSYAYVQESFDKTTSSHVFSDDSISCHSNQTPVSFYNSATSRSTESGTGFEWSALKPRLTNAGYGADLIPLRLDSRGGRYAGVIGRSRWLDLRDVTKHWKLYRGIQP